MEHPRLPLGGEQENAEQYKQLPPSAAQETPQQSVAEQQALPAAESPASHEQDSAPPVERRTNKEILAIAKGSIESVAEQVRRFERTPGVRELANHFVASGGTRIPARLFIPELAPGHPHRRETLASITDCATFRLWSRSKVVYAMDDLLLHYLSESSPSRIPTSILKNLPHPDPYILLPKPDPTDPETNYYRTHIGIPVGAFVFGRYDEARQLCSTAAEQREDLGLMFACLLETVHGVDFVTLRCTIPLQQETFTVEDAVNATIAKFNFTDDLAEDDPAKLQAWLQRHVAQAFNSLLYVCTEQPDIEVQQPGTRRGKITKSRARRRPRPDDIDMVVKLGFRMGPTLHEARIRSERAQNQQPSSGGSGPRKRPHQKKGHYRTYWTGQGRTQAVLRWINPFWVNEEDLLGTTNEPKDVVVRPVRKRT